MPTQAHPCTYGWNYPPTDMQGVLAASAQRDLLLWRWLTFTQRYPLVVMPTLGDLALPHNLDTTREGVVRVLDSIRVSLIRLFWGFLRWRCRSAITPVCVRACRSWRRASARICASMPAR